MPLFQQYAQPGVYTTVVVEEAGVTPFGDARIPIFVGEGQENRVFKNIELHRGSSAVADDRRVQENLSDQVTGFGRSYMLAFAPVVRGDGQGTITSETGDIKVYADGIPILVSSLNGETGEFLTQSILPIGTDLRVDYFFKRMDTYVKGEDLSDQIPSYAVFTGMPGMTLSLSNPGFKGNKVKLAFTLGTPASDALAVSGVGTDTISIELNKIVNGATVVRTHAQIKELIETGIPTLSGGYLTIPTFNAVDANVAGIAVASASFLGGAGQDTNKIFKLKNVPVVDGTNGGVVTSSLSAVKVTVNGAAAKVAALNGLEGYITLEQSVPYGASLKASYYTNRYQDTWDDLPAENVNAILQAGFAPDREDFINTIDYVLDKDKIHWGSTVITEYGKFTAGFVPFDGAVITTTMVDEHMYLRPVEGLVNGLNTDFALEDVPTDGSGRSVPTDNPEMIKVYIGQNPIAALAAGPVRVTRVHGANKSLKLYAPPQTGVRVFASYWRNVLNDHTFTLEVVSPGITGQGTYKIHDENGGVAPVLTWDAAATHVLEANFANTGIVWPYSFKDLRCIPGQAPDESITITFQDDGLQKVTAPPVQAVNETAEPGLRFRATNTGTAPNNTVTVRMVGGGAPTVDASAVSVVADAVRVELTKGDGSTRTLQDIITLFSSQTITNAKTGRILCEASGSVSDLTTLGTDNGATPFIGGAAQVSTPYSNRFKVSSSRTQAEAIRDGLGRTGGYTTDAAVPAQGADTGGAEGFLGQTFFDADTGIAFTLVDPNNALAYGYTSEPSPSYNFRPGDTLVFNTSSTANHVSGPVPDLGIPGLRLKVSNTLGMFATDTALVRTYNKAGNEPAIGEFYYVSYQTKKIERDMGLKLFTNLADVYREYGDPLPTNKLALAARVFIQNGGSLFGCLQVPKEVGLETASDQTYIDAIASLARPLPGSDRKCDVIVPLTTSPVVQQFLGKHLNTQAAPRNKGEAIGFLGMPITATVADTRNLARALKSERVVLIYPGGAILSVDISGKSAEFAVGGEFLAAAMCGMYSNPGVDVATTLTRQKMVGFDRLVRRTEDAIMDLAAADGVCLLTEADGAFFVRHYITTNPANPITREPTNTTITDYVRQRSRKILDQFIGRKNLQNVLNDIAIVMNALLKGLIEQEIIEGYRGLEVQKDEDDPSVVHVKVAFKPVFSLLWIDVTFRVTTRL